MNAPFNHNTLRVPFDREAIAQHFVNLHHLAERAAVPGKLVLAVFGEDPDTRKRVSEVLHFQIGDVEGMTSAAMAFEGRPHHNIYAPLAIMRPDLPDGRKGEEYDVVAVLGLVVDGDADKNRDAPTPPSGAPANYLINTSLGNQQHFLFLDRALPPDEAKQYGSALKRATRGECADDISHVWRVPGCLNWPNAAKIKRGRSREPQPVSIVRQWETWTKVDQLRRALGKYWEELRDEPTAPRSDRNVDTAKARAFHERLRDAGYYDAGEDARKRYTRAAKALSYDLGDEGRKIWKDVVCWNGTRQDEGTAVDEKEANYRWRECSRLRDGAKPITHGSLIEEARKLYGWSGLYLERAKTATEMFKDVPPEALQGAGMATPGGTTKIEDHEQTSKALPFIGFGERRPGGRPKAIIKGFICEGQTSSIFAPPKHCKSTLVDDICRHIADVSKKEWRGMKIKKHCAAIYFAFERSEQTLDAFEAYAIRDKVEGLPIKVVPRLIDMINSGCVDIIEATIEAVEEETSLPVGLLVFDTWNKGIAAGGGDENQAQWQNQAAANLRRLIERRPALHCLTVGHTGKDRSKGERGSNATEGDRDVGVTIEKDKNHFTVKIAYANALAEGHIVTVFEGEVIEIGKDEDGDPIESWIVGKRLLMPRSKDAGIWVTKKEGLALKALQTALKEKGQVREQIGGLCVTIDEWMDQCLKNGAVLRDTKKPKRDLQGRQEGLLTKGLIVVDEDLVTVLPIPNDTLPPIPERGEQMDDDIDQGEKS